MLRFVKVGQFYINPSKVNFVCGVDVQGHGGKRFKTCVNFSGGTGGSVENDGVLNEVFFEAEPPVVVELLMNGRFGDQ